MPCLDFHVYKHNPITLVFGLELKYLVLWQFLLLTCAAPTHAQMYLGNNYIINLTVTPTFGGVAKSVLRVHPLWKPEKNILWKW